MRITVRRIIRLRIIHFFLCDTHLLNAYFAYMGIFGLNEKYGIL